MNKELLLFLFAASTSIAMPKHVFAAVDPAPVPGLAAQKGQCGTDTFYDHYVDITDHEKTATQLAYGVMYRLDKISHVPGWSGLMPFSTDERVVPTVQPVDLGNEFNVKVTYGFCWGNAGQ